MERLIVNEGQGPVPVDLTAALTRIGGDPYGDVVLKHPSAQRSAFVIERTTHGHRARLLDGELFHNEQRVTQADLLHNDTLRVGETLVLYKNPAATLPSAGPAVVAPREVPAPPTEEELEGLVPLASLDDMKRPLALESLDELEELEELTELEELPPAAPVEVLDALEELEELDELEPLEDLEEFAEPELPAAAAAAAAAPSPAPVVTSPEVVELIEFEARDELPVLEAIEEPILAQAPAPTPSRAPTPAPATRPAPSPAPAQERAPRPEPVTASSDEGLRLAEGIRFRRPLPPGRRGPTFLPPAHPGRAPR